MITLSQFFRSCCVLPDGISSYASKTQYLREFRQMFGSGWQRVLPVLYMFLFVIKRYRE